MWKKLQKIEKIAGKGNGDDDNSRDLRLDSDDIAEGSLTAVNFTSPLREDDKTEGLHWAQPAVVHEVSQFV